MSTRGDLWLRLVQSVATVEAELGKILQDRYGLGLSDYRALEALERAPKSELRMQELAAHLQLNQSSVSRMVERLERGGLTVRDLCPDDKRGVYTVLTDKGRAHLTAARPHYENALETAMARHGGAEALAVAFASAGQAA